MADKFDPYRESLVLETTTVWPPGYEHLEDGERAEIESALHSDPENCEHIEYVRLHSGFCRQITVTEGDLERIAS